MTVRCLLAGVMCLGAACAATPERVLTISGSMLGREGQVLRLQLDRFRLAHPGLSVALRDTPDAADQRHQLFVQWLNARVGEPDVLQLDIVWTPEFAAAGWIRPLDAFDPRPATCSRLPLRPTGGGVGSTHCRGSSMSACCTGVPT
ncbi:MAG: hypothetical protein ABI024_04400 [Vicinamibacterales bacterium]